VDTEKFPWTLTLLAEAASSLPTVRTPPAAVRRQWTSVCPIATLDEAIE
jgi:hypothetical protein